MGGRKWKASLRELQLLNISYKKKFPKASSADAESENFPAGPAAVWPFPKTPPCNFQAPAFWDGPKSDSVTCTDEELQGHLLELLSAAGTNSSANASRCGLTDWVLEGGHASTFSHSSAKWFVH